MIWFSLKVLLFIFVSQIPYYLMKTQFQLYVKMRNNNCFDMLKESFIPILRKDTWLTKIWWRAVYGNHR